MSRQSSLEKITSYSLAVASVVGKSLAMFALVAALGFTQNLYGFDVRLNSTRPMLQVRLVVFDKLHHVSWHKVVEFVGKLFQSAHPTDQACRVDHPNRQRQVG